MYVPTCKRCRSCALCAFYFISMYHPEDVRCSALVLLNFICTWSLTFALSVDMCSAVLLNRRVWTVYEFREHRPIFSPRPQIQRDIVLLKWTLYYNNCSNKKILSLLFSEWTSAIIRNFLEPYFSACHLPGPIENLNHPETLHFIKIGPAV